MCIILNKRAPTLVTGLEFASFVTCSVTLRSVLCVIVCIMFVCMPLVSRLHACLSCDRVQVLLLISLKPITILLGLNKRAPNLDTSLEFASFVTCSVMVLWRYCVYRVYLCGTRSCVQHLPRVRMLVSCVTVLKCYYYFY